MLGVNFLPGGDCLGLGQSATAWKAAVATLPSFRCPLKVPRGDFERAQRTAHKSSTFRLRRSMARDHTHVSSSEWLTAKVRSKASKFGPVFCQILQILQLSAKNMFRTPNFTNFVQIQDHVIGAVTIQRARFSNTQTTYPGTPTHHCSHTMTIHKHHEVPIKNNAPRFVHSFFR